MLLHGIPRAIIFDSTVPSDVRPTVPYWRKFSWPWIAVAGLDEAQNQLELFCRGSKSSDLKNRNGVDLLPEDVHRGYRFSDVLRVVWYCPVNAMSVMPLLRSQLVATVFQNEP